MIELSLQVHQNVLSTWEVPGIREGEYTHIEAMAGEFTVIVGANGAGKSALGWKLEQTGNNAKRLIAHRRLWFQSAGPDISSSGREATASNLKSWSIDPASRYLDHGNQQRTDVVLFDLIARYNAENATIADMARAGEDLSNAASVKSILDRLNAIFSGAALPLSFKLTEHSTIEARHAVRGASYPIFQMSDGEKSALLLTAEILSSASGTTFIIDEPERHLHRSISAGLVAALMADRKDSHFVILTHDLDLAASLPDATANKFVVTNCIWQGATATGWELHSVTETSLPEDVRRAVLGGRNRILFLEGQNQSLDNGLYGVLYPDFTLSPVGSCEQVRRAVAGIRESSDHHWIEAVGIIDGDGRELDEIATLAARGLIVLPVSEIESLYYVEPVMRSVVTRQAEFLGLQSDELYDNAISAAINALGQGDAPRRLAASVAEKRIYRKATSALPDRQAIAGAGASFQIQVESPFHTLFDEYQTMVAAADLESLLEKFPIRDTSARDAIASTLRFKSYADYEAAALTMLRGDPSLVSAVRDLIGPLSGS